MVQERIGMVAVSDGGNCTTGGGHYFQLSERPTAVPGCVPVEKKHAQLWGLLRKREKGKTHHKRGKKRTLKGSFEEPKEIEYSSRGKGLLLWIGPDARGV